MKNMLGFLLMLGVVFTVGCSSKVIVKKDTCKDIYDGALMECETVSK